VFHALADPGRRLMLERLSAGPASVSELDRPLAMSLAAVLQHVLRVSLRPAAPFPRWSGRR
jgi:DNA-binding transcriptional ArsR family regulator